MVPILPLPTKHKKALHLARPRYSPWRSLAAPVLRKPPARRFSFRAPPGVYAGTFESCAARWIGARMVMARGAIFGALAKVKLSAPKRKNIEFNVIWGTNYMSERTAALGAGGLSDSEMLQLVLLSRAVSRDLRKAYGSPVVGYDGVGVDVPWEVIDI